MIDYGLFMMIYKPSKLIYSSVHINRVYHFIRGHFSRIPLYTYISFNGPDRRDDAKTHAHTCQSISNTISHPPQQPALHNCRIIIPRYLLISCALTKISMLDRAPISTGGPGQGVFELRNSGKRMHYNIDDILIHNLPTCCL